MAYTHSATTVIAGPTVYSVLAQFPVVCFTLTLLTDLAYWYTEYLMWQEFSSWLLFAGLVFAAFAILAGIVELLIGSAHWPAWPHVIGSLIVVVLAFFNSLVHAGDGWTAVVPWGLALSALTVVVMLVTGWFGRRYVIHYSRGAIHHD
jgi:uncharacterized membrane protein